MGKIRTRNRRNVEKLFGAPVQTASVQVQTTAVQTTSMLPVVKMQRILSTPKTQTANQANILITTPLKRRISPRTLAKTTNPTPPKRRKVGNPRMSWSWIHHFPSWETDIYDSVYWTYRCNFLQSSVINQIKNFRRNQLEYLKREHQLQSKFKKSTYQSSAFMKWNQCRCATIFRAGKSSSTH
jgi:hypothetical protein